MFKKVDFDIDYVMDELSKRRKVFGSEADFQLEMAMVIKELYEDVRVRLEFPIFSSDGVLMHIDILVLFWENGETRGIPIELKYKTKGCTLITKTKDVKIKEKFNLKEHGAKNDNCVSYVKDIHRIEDLRKGLTETYGIEFQEGYTVFLTNDLSYLKKPRKNAKYIPYSLHGDISNIKMAVEKLDNTLKVCNLESFDDFYINENIYDLGNECYFKSWKFYSYLDGENYEIVIDSDKFNNREEDVNTFVYLVSKIENK